MSIQSEPNSPLELNFSNAQDTTIGLEGHESVSGDAGNNTAITSDTVDLLDAGNSIDTLNYEDGELEVFNNLLSDLISQGTVNISNLESVLSSIFEVGLTGKSENDVLVNGEGNDTLTGGQNSDPLKLETLSQSVANDSNSVDALEEGNSEALSTNGDVATYDSGLMNSGSQTFLVLDDSGEDDSVDNEMLVDITGLTGSNDNTEPATDENLPAETEVEETPTEAEAETEVEDLEGNIIDVDNDFDGDLERAVSAAKDGDTVQLGANTYETSGISI